MRLRFSGRGTHSSKSSNMRFGHLAAEFQGGNSLLAGDRGEAVEELVQSIASVKMVVQGFHGDAGPSDKPGTIQAQTACGCDLSDPTTAVSLFLSLSSHATVDYSRRTHARARYVYCMSRRHYEGPRQSRT